ncbi:hypothetical protein [Komagataeibacter swingsii]|uniref:hypothetical protein n=1 Tax=Komagataeibacter swingsii TaxID=215220 RepID=UPI00142E84E1|nr:hypothetical protein [Komagataeibacter swingsii]
MLADMAIAGKGGASHEKFLVKLFSKSFKERRLFEKRRHPKTFIYYQCVALK